MRHSVFCFALLFTLPSLYTSDGEIRTLSSDEAQWYLCVAEEDDSREEAGEPESAALIKDRLKCIENIVPLDYNRRVHGFINYFTIKDRPYSEMVLSRADTYFPLFSKYLARYKLPDELKYLAVVESSLNPRARSGVGAVGLWQFMPLTGQEYGLSRTRYIDDRRDPDQSTRAACRYLGRLYETFDSWELALMAYNSGPGSVRKAIKRAGNRRQAKHIYPYLPRETRSYLSQFVALTYMFNYHREHNLFPVASEIPTPRDTIHIRGAVHLPTLANLVDSDMETFSALNPAALREVVPAQSSPNVIYVPASAKLWLVHNRSLVADSVRRVAERTAGSRVALRHTDKPSGKRLSYRVQPGDVLGSIAQRFNVGIHDLLRWNNLKGTRIHTGQNLTLWTSSPSPSAVKQTPTEIVAADRVIGVAADTTAAAVETTTAMQTDNAVAQPVVAKPQEPADKVAIEQPSATTLQTDNAVVEQPAAAALQGHGE